VLFLGMEDVEEIERYKVPGLSDVFSVFRDKRGYFGGCGLLSLTCWRFEKIEDARDDLEGELKDRAERQWRYLGKPEGWKMFAGGLLDYIVKEEGAPEKSLLMGIGK